MKLRKMNNSRNIKIKYVTDVFLSVKSSCMKIYTYRWGVKNFKSNGFLNSIKIMRIVKLLFTLKWVLITKN